MSQLASLVDLLANDPEVQALIDQLQGQGAQLQNSGFVARPPIPQNAFDLVRGGQEGLRGLPGGGLSGLPTRLGQAGGQLLGLSPDQFESVRRSAFNVDRLGALGSPALSVDQLLTFIGQQQADPRAGGVPISFAPPPPAQIIGGPNAPPTALPSGARQGFGPTAGPIGQNQPQQSTISPQTLALRTGLDDTIEQLSQAFGSRDRIPPIGSSFIGAEPLEGAIAGSTSVYGVTAGPFTLGRFTSQEAADQARDVLRRELNQGPAPPPSFIAGTGVVSPFARTGAQQFDDQRAFSQEQRLAFNALQDAGFDVRAPGRRGGGAAGGGGGRRVGGGGGRPFAMVQKSIKLPAVGGPGGTPAGFVMVESAQNFRLPDIAGRDGVTPGGQRSIDILSGRSGITSMRQAKRLAGDTADIRELLDRDALSPDEAIAAEIMRARLEASTDPVGSKGRGQRVRSILQGLGDAVMTRQEAETALKALGIARGESELIGIADSQQAALFEASQRARRGRQGDTRFTERETKPEELARRDRERKEAVLNRREDAALRRQQTLDDRIFQSELRDVSNQTAAERAQNQDLKFQMRPIEREIARIKAALRRERSRRPTMTAATAEAEGKVFDGPDQDTIQRLIDDLEVQQDLLAPLTLQLNNPTLLSQPATQPAASQPADPRLLDLLGQFEAGDPRLRAALAPFIEGRGGTVPATQPAFR